MLCLHVFCVVHECLVLEEQVLEPLNLELQIVVSHHRCAAIEHKSSAKATSTYMLTYLSST